MMAPESFRFCVIEYHTLRTTGSLVQALIYKAGFLSRLLQGYFVAIAVWAGAVVARWLLDPAPPESEAAAPQRCLARMLWAGILGISLVHILAPFPYEDYQVFVYPLFAAVVAALAVRCSAARAEAWLATVILALSLAAALSSPVNQDWFILGRDRIWWRMKSQAALLQLREVGARLRALAGPGELLLTQDPYLAVESGLLLPHGLEMGQFSYFPDLAPDQARQYNVLSRSQFENLLETCPAPVAAFSGYAFAMRSPKVEPASDEEQALFRRLVEARYEPAGVVSNFGQAFTTLRIYKKKPLSSRFTVPGSRLTGLNPKPSEPATVGMPEASAP
jgi:hypothetical protein